MCLYSIDKKTKNWKVGYKVFKKYGKERVKTPIYPHIYKLNTWVKDKTKIYLRSIKDREKYESGFHFFKNKRDAVIYNRVSNEIVLKIKVRNLIVTGTSKINNYNRFKSWKNRPVLTGVAKEMFIIMEDN